MDRPKDKLKVAGAVTAVAMMVGIVSDRRQGDIIRAMSESYSTALNASLVTVVELSEEELNARAVADMEHEMLIAGHEEDCAICIEANRKKSAIEKWAGKDWARWRR